MPDINLKKVLRFVNVGEDPPIIPVGADWVGRRQWSACVKYGFISAGQGLAYNQPLLHLDIGDVVAAFITGSGYVGVGIVTAKAKKIKDFKFGCLSYDQLNIDPLYLSGVLFDDETVNALPPLRKTLFKNADNENCEYVVSIEWQDTVTRENAHWIPNFGLFASPAIQCDLQHQVITKQFLQDRFDVNFL